MKEVNDYGFSVGFADHLLPWCFDDCWIRIRHFQRHCKTYEQDLGLDGQMTEKEVCVFTASLFF